ncbi:hypothetical protein CLF_112742, partial [Clonorchis sinensis]
ITKEDLDLSMRYLKKQRYRLQRRVVPLLQDGEKTMEAHHAFMHFHSVVLKDMVGTFDQKKPVNGLFIPMFNRRGDDTDVELSEWYLDCVATGHKYWKLKKSSTRFLTVMTGQLVGRKQQKRLTHERHPAFTGVVRTDETWNKKSRIYLAPNDRDAVTEKLRITNKNLLKRLDSIKQFLKEHARSNVMIQAVDFEEQQIQVTQASMRMSELENLIAVRKVVAARLTLSLEKMKASRSNHYSGKNTIFVINLLFTIVIDISVEIATNNTEDYGAVRNGGYDLMLALVTRRNPSSKVLTENKSSIGSLYSPASSSDHLENPRLVTTPRV